MSQHSDEPKIGAQNLTVPASAIRSAMIIAARIMIAGSIESSRRMGLTLQDVIDIYDDEISKIVEGPYAEEKTI